MAVRKKVSSKNIDSDSAVSEKSAAATAAPAAAKKKAAGKKTTASKRKRVASKQPLAAANQKATGKKPQNRPASAKASPTNGAKPVISQQQRQQMIGDAAYLISLKRAPWLGNPDTDWMSAETVIDMIFDVEG